MSLNDIIQKMEIPSVSPHPTLRRTRYSLWGRTPGRLVINPVTGLVSYSGEHIASKFRGDSCTENTTSREGIEFFLPIQEVVAELRRTGVIPHGENWGASSGFSSWDPSLSPSWEFHPPDPVANSPTQEEPMPAAVDTESSGFMDSAELDEYLHPYLSSFGECLVTPSLGPTSSVPTEGFLDPSTPSVTIDTDFMEDLCNLSFDEEGTEKSPASVDPIAATPLSAAESVAPIHIVISSDDESSTRVKPPRLKFWSKPRCRTISR